MVVVIRLCHGGAQRFLEAPRHSISFRLRLVNSPLNREHRDAVCILFLNCEEIYLDAWDFLKILLYLKFFVSGTKILIGLDVKLPCCDALTLDKAAAVLAEGMLCVCGLH